MDILGMVAKAGPVVKGVLALLLVMSIVSVGIMLSRWRAAGSYRSGRDAFLARFRKARSAHDAAAVAASMGQVPHARLFEAYAGEMRLQMTGAGAGHGGLQLANVERVLDSAIGREAANMESGLAFLASTASSAPFIGLFGTVWGIMTSFHEIGESGQASLDSVAPGISEALVVTAAGLATAIPALLAFNHFQRKLKGVRRELTEFSTELMNEAARRFPGA